MLEEIRNYNRYCDSYELLVQQGELSAEERQQLENDLATFAHDSPAETGLKTFSFFLPKVPLDFWICPGLHIKLGLTKALLDYLFS
jgi:hypothetical protein